MQRLLVILILCGCQATTTPQPPLAVPAAEPGEADDPAAPSAPARSEAVAAETYEFFWEETDLDAEQYLDGFATPLGQGLVLVGDTRDGPLGVLHTDTLEIDEVGPYVGEPKQRPTMTSAVEHGALVAMFTDRKEGIVSFQVLRLNTLRWEKAGRFDIPASRALDDSRKISSSWSQLRDGELRLDLSDEVDDRKSYVLDFETLVWKEVPPAKIDHGPCVMSSTHEADDRVRWGVSASDENAGPCVAVRATTEDDWRVLDSPPEDLMFMRNIHPIDERRFLVTGGFRFALFPFVHQVDVVDVVSGEIRTLGKEGTGTHLDVPGERFVWLAKDAVVRFDPESEQFSRSPGPRLDFRPTWWIKLDDRRVLFGGRDDEKAARFVIAGFRPVP